MLLKGSACNLCIEGLHRYLIPRTATVLRCVYLTYFLRVRGQQQDLQIGREQCVAWRHF